MFFGVRLKENPFYYHTFSNIYKRKMVERLNETIIKQNYQQKPKKKQKISNGTKLVSCNKFLFIFPSFILPRLFYIFFLCVKHHNIYT